MLDLVNNEVVRIYFNTLHHVTISQNIYISTDTVIWMDSFAWTTGGGGGGHIMKIASGAFGEVHKVSYFMYNINVDAQ